MCEQLNKRGPGSCHYFVADISVSARLAQPYPDTDAIDIVVTIQTKAGCDALANQIKERESKVHILVNNSGASWGAPYDRQVLRLHVVPTVGLH